MDELSKGVTDNGKAREPRTELWDLPALRGETRGRDGEAVTSDAEQRTTAVVQLWQRVHNLLRQDKEEELVKGLEDQPYGPYLLDAETEA